ncbi:MAG TPA: DUF402 domain-containing protein [Actinomycetota bacterium]|nr:DUF402 domain-containing protein [Actinomycetota bacterium]
MTFAPGTSIALRETLRGAVWAARPAIVVRDDEELQMFFLPIGNRWFAADTRDRDDLIRTKATAAEWRLTARTWTDLHVLSFAWVDAGHAVLHFWDEDWVSRGWYINVQRPLRRFAVGFDTLDEDLDVVIEADRSSWRWKDEDDVALARELGLYTAEDAQRFHVEGARGRDRVLRREPPFDEDWPEWRPDPSWPMPRLPDGWDVLEA